MPDRRGSVHAGVEGRAEIAERELAEELFAARPRDHQLQALDSRQGESTLHSRDLDQAGLHRRIEVRILSADGSAVSHRRCGDPGIHDLHRPPDRL